LVEGGALSAADATKPHSRSALPRSTIGLALGAAVVVCVALFLVPRRDDTHVTPASASADAAITAAVIPSDVDAGSDWSWLRFGVMDVVASHLRASGVPTVPSENVIALLATPASQRSGSLRAAAGFGWMVVHQPRRCAVRLPHGVVAQRTHRDRLVHRRWRLFGIVPLAQGRRCREHDASIGPWG